MVHYLPMKVEDMYYVDCYVVPFVSQTLGINEPFMYKLVDIVADIWNHIIQMLRKKQISLSVL